MAIPYLSRTYKSNSYMSIYRPYYRAESFRSPLAAASGNGDVARYSGFDYLEDVNQLQFTAIGVSAGRLYARQLLSQPFDVARFLLQIGSWSNVPKPYMDEVESSDEDIDYFVDVSASKPAVVDGPRLARLTARPKSHMKISRSLQIVRTHQSLSPKLYPSAIEITNYNVTDILMELRAKEGLPGLWRSIHTSCLIKAASGLLQAWITSFLATLLKTADPQFTDPMQCADVTLVLAISTVACAATAALLAPISMIRAQFMSTTLTTQPRSLRYALTNLNQLVAPPSVVVPTVLASSAPHFIQQATPVFFLKRLGLDIYNTPGMYHVMQFFSSLLQLLVKMPLETIAHRAQVAALALDPSTLIVPLKPFNGVFSTLFEIVSGRESILSLYRGWRLELLGLTGEWGSTALHVNRPAKEHF